MVKRPTLVRVLLKDYKTNEDVNALLATTSTSLTFPFPGYSTLVFFYLEFYNKEVASSGRSAVSPVSEVSGLTLIIPGTRSGWR